MRKIIELFVRQHLFGDLLTIAVIGIGIYSALTIRRETFPNINFDIINISTVFPGAAPDDVERLVSTPLEQDIKEVDGIKKVISVAVENQSAITVFLDPDQTTEEEGKSDIKDVVDRFTDLPDGAEDPVVTAIQTKLGPIMEVAIGGDIPDMELRQIALNLEKEIEKIKGVAKVVHRGLRDLEIRVEPDVKKLAQYRLSLDEIVEALKRQNISIPGGVVEANLNDPDSKERLVRTRGDFVDLNDVMNTVVRANDLGQPVYIKDVASVRYDLERAKVVTRTNGQAGLTLTVLRKDKSDAINVVDDVKARLDQLKPTLDSRLSISYVNDLSQYIRRRLSILTGNLLIGFLLVLFLLPLLIPFRFSILIALGVPFAFLGSIAVMYQMGLSISLISMMGLIIVCGMLVDDAIVVTENSVRLIESGMDPKEAAIEGSSQMVGPVLGSVLTTVMAFLPMMFMSGIFGKFIKFIPMGVLIALFVSLFEAFIVLPGHISSWINIDYIRNLKAPPKKDDSRIKKFLRWTRGFWDEKVVPIYLRWLRASLRRRYRFALGLFVFFIATMVLAVKGMRFVLFPPEGVEIFFIRTETPVGTSLEQHAKLLAPIESAVKGLKENELDNFTTTVGLVQQDPNDPNTRRGANFAQVAVFLTPENLRKRKADEIIAALRESVGKPPGFDQVVFARVNPGPPTGKPVSLGVRGSEYKDILPAVNYLKDLLATFDGVTDISDSYLLGKEELRVKVNSAEAAAAGLSVASIANSVRSVYEGVIATKVRTLDEEIAVRVSAPANERSTEAALGRHVIPNPMGQLIPLSQVSSIENSRGILYYEHEGFSRQVRVSADVDIKKTTSLEVNGRIRKLLPEIQQKFPGLSIDFGGEDEDTKESFQSLGRAFGVAVIGIFLILVLIFKSLLQPLLVLLTIPLGVIAVVWAFFFHGMPLSFMGMLGIVALAGVIVNNAIVFVDFVNQRRLNGSSNEDSIMEAGRDRIRPIFLTTATTVAGILPTAYGIGGLDKFVVPIAMALGWGIAFGSMLSTFAFPASMAILDDITNWLGRKRGAKQA